MHLGLLKTYTGNCTKASYFPTELLRRATSDNNSWYLPLSFVALNWTITVSAYRTSIAPSD